MKTSTPYLLLLFLQLSLISMSQAQNPETEKQITSTSFQKGFLPKRTLENNQAYSCTQDNCELIISAETEYTLTLKSGAYFAGEFTKDSGEKNIVVSYNSSSSSPYIAAGIFLKYKGYDSILFDSSRGALWTVVVPSYTMRSENFQSVLLVIKNDSDSPTTIVFKITYAPASVYTASFSVVGIVLPIVAVSMAILATGFLLYLRRKRQNRQRMQREQTMRENNKQNSVAENDPLTVENLNDRFPDANFSSLKSSFTQTTCSICIEELNGEKTCRQLYCEHIFHSECIKLWINNELRKGYASCPNCKKDLMKKNPQIFNLKLKDPEQ